MDLVRVVIDFSRPLNRQSGGAGQFGNANFSKARQGNVRQGGEPTVMLPRG